MKIRTNQSVNDCVNDDVGVMEFNHDIDPKVLKQIKNKKQLFMVKIEAELNIDEINLILKRINGTRVE